MGFKQTSEGRVFFQNADERKSAKAQDPQFPSERSPLKATGIDNSQAQIVTLLKTLNERLKLTQAERNSMRKELDSYRDLIGELEDRAEKSERAYSDLEQKMSTSLISNKSRTEKLAGEAIKEMEETRRLLLELEGKNDVADRELKALKENVERHQKVGSQLLQKQMMFEKEQEKTAERFSEHSTIAAKLIQRIKDGEERYEVLNEKVEFTSTEQERMGRKLDKALEERVRFMRKIERIEETVLQTRDSLNAKAMVLLTDQNIVAHDEPGALTENTVAQLAARKPDSKLQEAAHISNNAPANQNDSSKSGAYFWAAAAACILALSGISYIALNAARDTNWSLLQASQQVYENASRAMSGKTIAQNNASEDKTVIENAALKQTQVPAINEMDWSIETAAPVAEVETDSVSAFSDDIGARDLTSSDQVQAALENALNNIEPGDDSAVTFEAIQASLDATSNVNTASAEDVLPPISAPSLSSIEPDKSLNDAVKKIEAHAFEGIAEAQHDLAAIYTSQQGGVAQDFQRAFQWFEQAAANGVANAMYNIGVMYHQGLGRDSDLEKAIAWYERAARADHPEAQYNLGIANIEGIGVPYNAQKAAAYFETAAEGGITESAYNLGLIYENGLLGEARPDMALMWYKIASDQGNAEAGQALEQLADSLDLNANEVNDLAETMKAQFKPGIFSAANDKSSSSQASSKPEAQSSPAENNQQVAVHQPRPENRLQIVTAQVQEYLMNNGLYPGPADGISGPLTVDAVRSYQRSHDLQVDGKVSGDLLKHMMSNSNALEQGSRAE